MMRRDGFAWLTGLWTALFCAFVGWSVSAQEDSVADMPPDLLSIGGEVTEIVYALGQGHRLLARDTTSTYPAEANKLPDVGYMRALSPEGVLSVGPSLILTAQGAGPVEAIEVLRAADVQMVEVPHGFDGAAIAEKIRVVGAALDVPVKAEALAREVTAALDSATALADSHTGPRKRVLFVLNARDGKLTVGGGATAADALITLAGGINAAQGFDGYKPMSEEAALAAAPDVVVMMGRGDHSLPADVLFAMPALALSPAAQAGALLKVDGLKALRFGPRTAEAVRDLNSALYGG
ncbi:MAG: ABC transporter substrate-binding protein [Pelagimonas sp.]|jgi:iron complex transport system substrate-binding protein|nr:ABC transporter substrate-binding protein [Pelagimonas sp.]